MEIVFVKVAVIFSMAALGYIANRTGILPDAANSYMVNLLMDITMPCMIIASVTSKTLTDDTLKEALEVVAGSVVFFAAASLVSLGIVKLMRYKPLEDQGIIMVIITSVNTGFMGFPVTKAIFGNEYFFLMVLENVILNLYMYSLCIMQMNYGHERKESIAEVFKPLCNIATFASLFGIILLCLHFKFPSPVMDFLNTVGDATIPLSMILVGMQLGNSNILKVLKNYKLLISSLLNVTLIPFLTYLAVNWLPIADPAKLILIYAAAFPCAVITVAIAAKEEKNAGLMAEGVALTTLFSMATLPVTSIILMSLYM